MNGQILRPSLVLLATIVSALVMPAVPDAALAKSDKAQYHGGKNGRGNSEKGNPGRGSSGRGGGKSAHTHGQDHGKGGKSWDDDWDADDLIRAGFDSAALLGALGGERYLLDTGAKPLPPGIRKNLARGKPLPPGIARQQPSSELLDRLPRVDGHEWLEVGTDLVLVAAGTAIIKEVLRGVLD